MLKFKRGAFSAMKTVIPCYCKFSYGSINPAYDVLQFWNLVIFMISSLGFYKATLVIMPPFEPTQEMLIKHADKGKTDWEIFAWCVRDAMAASSGMKVSD